MEACLLVELQSLNYQTEVKLDLHILNMVFY